MIVVAKLTLVILWLIAFLITCMILGVAFPIIILFERFQTMLDVARLN